MTRDQFAGCMQDIRAAYGDDTAGAVAEGLLRSLICPGESSPSSVEAVLFRYRARALAGLDIFTGEPCATSTA